MARSSDVLFLVIFSILGHSAYSTEEQQSLLGRWVGSISIMGTESSFQVDFTLGPQPSWSSKPPQQILKGTIDSPRHKLKGVELTHLRFDSSRVHFELPFPTFALFDGDLKNDKISGTYKEGKSRGSFSLIRIHEPQTKSKLIAAVLPYNPVHDRLGSRTAAANEEISR
jgi:hypothetical protein